MVPTDAALRILARLSGHWLPLDTYDGRYKHEAFPPSKVELRDALRLLESSGLVASIYERLDGPLYALTSTGRTKMEALGFEFSEVALDATRRLFSSYKCKAEL